MKKKDIEMAEKNNRNAQEAQKLLVSELEYDVTGVMDNAKLDFDQLVQYSIALSLKRICGQLEKHEPGR